MGLAFMVAFFVEAIAVDFLMMMMLLLLLLGKRGWVVDWDHSKYR